MPHYYKRHKKLFTETAPELLELWSVIMEKRFAARWTVLRIAKEFNMPKSRVAHIIYRYKAPVTGRDVTLIISSKLNYENA